MRSIQQKMSEECRYKYSDFEGRLLGEWYICQAEWKYSDFEGRLLGEWDVKQSDDSS